MSRVSRRYRFNGMTFDAGSRELLRDGRQIDIEPKAFDLLGYLIEHRDRAVDKNELQDQIWPGLIVTEASLTRCVIKARRAVGDESKPHRVIRTVHGFGYRFIADLESERASDKPGTARCSSSPAILLSASRTGA